MKAGITNVEIPSDIQLEVGEKFLGIAPLSTVGAATGAPYGVMLEVPEVVDLVMRPAPKILEVARAMNVAMSENHVDIAVEFLRAAPAGGLMPM